MARTKVKMTKKNRLAILTRARDIIADRKHWTKGKLRRRKGGEYQYCLLGACERAVYDLGLEEESKNAFKEVINDAGSEGLGYSLGRDLSLYAFSREKHGSPPYEVNDVEGHEGAVQLLDDYIKEVKKGKARLPE